MNTALVTFGAVTLALWAYLLLLRGFFWRVRMEESEARAARVVAVVPARNEAAHIGRAVQSLLEQPTVDLQVVVVDDASSDDTAALAREAAQWSGTPGRLTLISGAPLPQGWTGKMWAVHQGVVWAGELGADYLLLTDADIEHGPGSVAALVGSAGRHRADLTSYMVKLRCQSFAEKLLIPAFVYFFFKLYPPAWIADANGRTAGAAGGCMLVRPEALQRAGGIEAIRSEMIDDCALAKAIKRAGGRVWLGVTDNTRSLRHYTTFAQVGRMISRTAFNQLHHSALLLVGTIVGLFLTYIMPINLLGSGDRVAMVLGGISWACMTASYLPMVRFYRLNPLWAVTLPFAAVFYMGATVWSAVLYWTGRGGQWKGRAQDKASAAAK